MISMPFLRTFAVALATVATSTLAVPGPMPRARTAGPVSLGLQLHVATREGGAVVDDAFTATQLHRANAIFAPHGVSFVVAGRGTLPEGHATLVDRADRDALGALVTAGVIDVFFVARLYDMDQSGRVRRGVHWRSRTHRPAHYVIVSGEAFDEVLAHELGHFLGNHRHSDTPGNLMSYTRRPGLPFLDAAQVRRMRAALSGYLARGELVAR